MAGHKTTHTQLERFRLIDSLFADGEVIPFEMILDFLRRELRDSLLSESSVRRDFRYMKNELKAPLAYDKKLHGWYYTKPFKLPAEGFSDDEILYLKLIRRLVGQNSNDDFLYKSFDKLLEKITPEITKSLSNRFYIAPRPKPLIDDDVVEKVVEAIKNNYLLDFNYFSKWEPEERHRKIMPFQLVFDAGSLFLYGAGIKTPDKPRLFKLSKMHNVEILYSNAFSLPKNFRFREDFETGRFGAFQYDEEYEFAIEFYGEARSTIRENIWADNQTIEIDKKEGAVKLVFTTSQWIPVLMWVLSFGANARPLEPDWFVEEWKKNIIKMFDFIK